MSRKWATNDIDKCKGLGYALPNSLINNDLGYICSVDIEDHESGNRDYI